MEPAGGCQNYGPFSGTLNIRCRIITGIQKGTIILTTTHVKISIIRIPAVRFPFVVGGPIWVIVKIMVSYLIPIIIRHLIFRLPKNGP